MTLFIDKRSIDLIGGRKELDKQIAGFRKQLEDHKKTEGVPAPTAHPLVEAVVQHGGSYEQIEDEVDEVVKEKDEYVPPPPPEPSPPVPDETFEDMQEIALNFVSQLRYNRLRQGVAYKGHRISCTPDALASMITTLAATEDQANTLVSWKDSDGGFVDLERMDLVAVLKLGHKLTQKCFANERRLIEKVKAAKNGQEIQFVDTSAGWPT